MDGKSGSDAAPSPDSGVLGGPQIIVSFNPDTNSMVWARLDRDYLDQIKPEPEHTVSGRPLFPICRECVFVVREFLMFRGRVPTGKPVIASLDALYAAVYAQWRRTDPGKEKRSDQRWSLDWPHRSYRGGWVVHDRWEGDSWSSLYSEQDHTGFISDWHVSNELEI